MYRPSGLYPLNAGLIKRILINIRPRCYHTSIVTLGNEVSKQELNASHSTSSSVFPPGLNVKVNNIEKWALVWTGKYKKFSDVPNLVNHNVLERARSKSRVKLSLYMIAISMIACGVMIVSGKHAAARGESVVKMNEEFHRKYNEAHADK